MIRRRPNITLALLVAVAAGCARSSGPGVGSQAGATPAVGWRHDEHVFAAGVAPPAAEWRNPYKGDRGAATEGAKIFVAMNCDGCHGGGATGWVGPSLADGRWRFGGSDAAIFESIYYGRPHGMPAYGGLLRTPEAVWKLVTYLESLEPPTTVPTEVWER
ncbi:MAG TPA: c-type cytochrome [Gemmatimonadales bacterium]|nr:c-type cytochrome [Gemmatimonadales bacterium]